MSQKPKENFDSKIAVEPFYSASNLAHLRRGIDALDAGNGVEHEIVEDKSKAQRNAHQAAGRHWHDEARRVQGKCD